LNLFISDLSYILSHILIVLPISFLSDSSLPAIVTFQDGMMPSSSSLPQFSTETSWMKIAPHQVDGVLLNAETEDSVSVRKRLGPNRNQAKQNIIKDISSIPRLLDMKMLPGRRVTLGASAQSTASVPKAQDVELNLHQITNASLLPPREYERILLEVQTRLSFHVREGNMTVARSNQVLSLITDSFICSELIRLGGRQSLEFTDDVFERLQKFIDTKAPE